MEDVLLRQIRPSDFDFIFDMQSDASVRERLGIDIASITIASVNNKPVGFLKYSLYDDGIYELQFAVNNCYRGKGYGTKILDIATDNLFRSLDDCEKMILVIKNDNLASSRAAIKSGYLIDYDATCAMIKENNLRDGYVYSKINPYVSSIRQNKI